MSDIKNGKLLYHITSVENAQSIIDSGLLPRRTINGFDDIADHSILNGRSVHHLDDMVPFHFFAKNPFDGRVIRSNPEKEFMLITVRRQYARDNGWSVIPRHPLSGTPQIMEYDQGMDAIDWALMNERDYSNIECKLTCMAECLSPNPVPPEDFCSIIVRDENVRRYVLELLATSDLSDAMHVNVTPSMFP